jgi:hypothetical protein
MMSQWEETTDWNLLEAFYGGSVVAASIVCASESQRKNEVFHRRHDSRLYVIWLYQICHESNGAQAGAKLAPLAVQVGRVVVGFHDFLVGGQEDVGSYAGLVYRLSSPRL